MCKMIPDDCPVLDFENLPGYLAEYYHEDEGLYCDITACPFNKDEYCLLAEFVLNLVGKR